MSQVYVALKLRDDRQRSKDLFLKLFSFPDAAEAFEKKQQFDRMRKNPGREVKRKNDFSRIGRTNPPELKVEVGKLYLGLR